MASTCSSRDCETRALERVTAGGVELELGGLLPLVSADGRFVSFASSTTNAVDGSAVVFASRASDLVPGDTNGHTDVFVWQRESGVIERVNLAPDGSDANWDSGSPSISADGLVVACGSHASNLVPGDVNDASDVFIVERTRGQIELASVTPEGYPASEFSSLPQLSGDGRSVSFASLADDLAPGDLNHDYDAYVYDRASRRGCRRGGRACARPRRGGP